MIAGVSSTFIKRLEVVPYLDTANIRGRYVGLMPLWDGQRWHLWIPLPTGELMTMHPVETVRTDYVAKAPARPDDLAIWFVEVMWQHLSYVDIHHLTSAIRGAFHKLGTCVAKLKHLHVNRARVGHAASDFAAAELEHIAITARTVYDLLQEAMSVLWQNHVQLADPVQEAARKGSALPATFSKMVLHDKKRKRSKDEIVERFKLPQKIAAAYAELAPDFMSLRDTRDRIIHSGVGVQHVYSTDRGFCVDPSDPAFRGCEWQDVHRFGQNLVSVLPWIAKVVLTTIGACNALLRSFVETIQPSPALAPGYRVFVRGPSTAVLLEALSVMDGASPWWSAASSDPTVEDRIKQRAYFLWEQRSEGAPGDALSDWVNAEMIERG